MNRKSNKNLSTIYIGETQENWVSCLNNQRSHLQVKTEEDVEGNGMGLQGEEGNSHEDGKATVCKLTFAGPAETVRHRETLAQFAGFLSVYTPVVCQLPSCVQLFLTPWTAARQASLSTKSWDLLKLMSIKSEMLSNHLVLCCFLLLLPSIFPSIRVFSNELALSIR